MEKKLDSKAKREELDALKAKYNITKADTGE